MPYSSATARLLRYPLAGPIGGSGLSAVDLLIVEVIDADGVMGTGFSYCLGFGSGAVVAAAQELLAAFVIDKACDPPDRSWHKMAAALNRVGKGAHFLALAAIDLALWDAYARRRNEPLGLALGGRGRSVPVYGSGSFRPGMSGPQVAEIAVRYRERGVHAIKLRANSTEADAEQLRAVRAVLPADFGVMVDLNEKGNAETAGQLADTCSGYGVLWLEEPVPSHDLKTYVHLSAQGRVPIAGGEHWQGAFESLLFAEHAAVAYLQPDLAMAGGMTECLNIARRAEALGVKVAPHFLPSLFIHLAAAAPNVVWLEDFPLLEPLFVEPATFNSHGLLAMPASAGHGLHFDPDALRRYALT